MRIPLALLVFSQLLATAVAQEDAHRLESLQRLDLDLPISDQMVADLDGDGRAELLIALPDGKLRIHASTGASGFAPEAARELDLGPGERCLVAVGPAAKEKASLVVSLSPLGARAFRIGRDLAVEGPIVLASRARFDLRTGGPRFSAFFRDVNGDDRADILVPDADQIELWVQEAPTGPDERALRFRKTAKVESGARVANGTGNRANEDSFYSTVTIPDLAARDLNGDGRPDLVVDRNPIIRFHLQRADGTIPVVPDLVLDLGLYVDTTPASPLRPGYTVPGLDKTQLTIRDLDGDGIPDYMIAQRRKIWIFLGDSKGPQFVRLANVVRPADEMTALTTANLDEDGRPDLLLLRVQVPTIGTLIAGLLGSFKVDLRAVGYRNKGEGRFDVDPAWKRDLTFELPSLGEILRDPGQILRRFEDAGARIRETLRGDVDGDGIDDHVVFAERLDAVEIWKTRAGESVVSPNDLDQVLKSILFDDPDSEWDVDRAVRWIEGFGAAEVSRLSRGRPADASIDLPEAASAAIAGNALAEVDGRPGREIVVFWRPRSRPDRLIVQLLSCSRGPSTDPAK